ncbi:hypothetical protein CVT24_009730 [Panaeolus cyanescens]|uniref:Uncharacterized protein n=1 Tax=Panaeolus cyanescens TaxID=181874 RepID=A0A409Y9T1_9AGAR|nr:hypothetical protein CVT24_009730 [Panaeolus cyanescens]
MTITTLSDHIDAFTRHTRSINSSASQISNKSLHSSLFTRAVLNTHLGDLIRDIDPSELGLFTLTGPQNQQNYEKDTQQQHEIKRTEFTGATPLRRNPHRRDEKQSIEPEVYARAALKYVEQYQPIRPMPRAYDQIVSILNRLNDVRQKIDAFNSDLNKQPQENIPKEPLSSKAQIEQEEQRIRELQQRIAELNKKKDAAQKRRTASLKPSTLLEKKLPPTSPQEDNFWNTPIGPSRTLRFTESDNLMDEQVNLGDISTASFGSPTVRLADLAGLQGPIFQSTVAATATREDTPTLTEVNSEPGTSESFPETSESQDKASEPVEAPSPKRRETPLKASGPKKIRVNIELERIITKIISTMGNILLPEHRNTQGSPPVADIVAHLQQLASQSPQPDSPSTSAASTVSTDITGRPSVQDILTAHLFTTLISATPNHSMALSKVKENVQLKIKSCGPLAAGQTNTRILYGCVAKRLLKIDRGGGEQIVRFDI